MQKLKLNVPKIFTVGDVRLLPGINEVDDALFKAIESNPVFKDKVAKGMIEVLKPLKRQTAKSLIAEIGDTYDLKRLEGFLDDDRDVVVKAAKEQIELINATAVDGDDQE